MAAHQAPPFLGFSRQEHWSGLPFPSPTHESEKWKWSCSCRYGFFFFPKWKQFTICFSDYIWRICPYKNFNNFNKVSVENENRWYLTSWRLSSQILLSIFAFTFHFHGLEKEIATHSSVLAWRIPRTGEPGGLPSMGSHSQTWLKWLSSSSSIYVKVHQLS